MALLKVYVVFLSIYATVLTCDLKSKQEEIAAKAAIENHIKTESSNLNPRYRPHYHVAPPVGWMNDPNGFSYFKGQYHLFYQLYPLGAYNGPMHWGHVTSTNLVDWNQMPTALLPGPEMCFSGSAIEKDGTMVLMYTAHLPLEGQDPLYNETQYLAFSNDGIVFNKYINNPVIARSPNGSPDFRDPKIWKSGDYWYVVLGSKTTDNKGRVLLYRSSDMQNWDFKSVLGESNGTLGYMWECPDFFPLGDKYILLMSPQGIVAQGDRYKNFFQTGYIIGSFNYVNNEFSHEVDFQEIDYGHDFYATQTTERNGKRYLIAWFGMWEVAHPEVEDGWAGTMTIFRELTLSSSGDRILMKPVEEMTGLRETPAVHNGAFAQNDIITLNQTGELIVTGDLSQTIELEIKGSNGGLITLGWDLSKVVVNRDGDIRQGPWVPVSSRSWRIFLDASTMELFCGEGEVVFSSRVYPSGVWVVKNLSSQSLTVEAYKLRRSVPV